ncbi:MAG: alpha-ketoglutarate-dependent dioxygenase AlkB, partial [Gammaproteobacteria bacterium]|nr:alpha-ketoglutarate-dependent dioxygenase AlkB [Gammaproteobacteria bacterium]
MFGDQTYSYSKETAKLPLHSLTSSVVGEVLDCVNNRLGTSFNSVLVNKYANKNVALGWHQDDEPIVDQSAPIATLSFGATRRFCISNSPRRAEQSQLFIVDLKPNSVFVMKPGLQQSHYHRVSAGRDNISEECGVRYSLTFRQLLPGVSSTEANPLDVPDEHSKCLESLVFGSSLTKGLKENLLSRRGKRFAVYHNSGAHVNDIKQDVINSATDTDVCRKCVKSISLVCGGNDTESNNTNYVDIVSDFESLLDVVGSIYPNAVINVISLIPRRIKYSNHLQQMINV